MERVQKHLFLHAAFPWWRNENQRNSPTHIPNLRYTENKSSLCFLHDILKIPPFGLWVKTVEPCEITKIAGIYGPSSAFIPSKDGKEWVFAAQQQLPGFLSNRDFNPTVSAVENYPTYVYIYIYTYIYIYIYHISYIVNDISSIFHYPLVNKHRPWKSPIFHGFTSLPTPMTARVVRWWAAVISGPRRARMPMTGPAGASCKRQRPVRLKVPDKKKELLWDEAWRMCMCIYIYIYIHIIFILSSVASKDSKVCSHMFLRLYPFFYPFSELLSAVCVLENLVIELLALTTGWREFNLEISKDIPDYPHVHLFPQPRPYNISLQSRMSRHRLDLPEVLEAFWAARGRLVGEKPLHLEKIAFLENLHPSWAIYGIVWK